MDERAVTALLRLFASKIEDRHAVVSCRPDRGRVDIESAGLLHRVYLDRAVLDRELADADDLGQEVWGTPLPAVEALARLLTIFLDESLETRERHPDGWWSYVGAGFDPVPPWEVTRR